MKMTTSQANILTLLLLILISDSRALSPATSPAHSPKHSPKRTPVSSPPLPPAIPPSYSLSPSPAISEPDCTSALLNLTSCLTFVEQGANLTVPEKGCCPSLAGMIDSNPFCLCQLLATSNTFGIKIDNTKALMLPTICHVQTPPVSLCTAIGIPIASPEALSPAAVPSGLGSLAPATSIAAAPSSGGDGDSTAIARSLQLALLAIIGQLIFISF